MARKKGSTGVTVKKQDYVKQLVAKDPGISMLEARGQVVKKFGSMLAFPKLKEAFIQAGGVVAKGPGRRAKAGPRKGGRKAAATSVAPAGKRRGPGRPKGSRNIGRRAADQRAAATSSTLTSLPSYMVVTIADGAATPNVFGSSRDAEQHVRRLIEGGTPASIIGFYERRTMDVSVSVSL